MYATAFIAAANLILSVTLIITIGFIGALIGTSISMTLGNVVYLYRFNRYLGVSFSDFLKFTLFKPVFSAAVAGAIIHYSQNLVLTSNLNFSESRMYMIIYLGLVGSIFVITYSIGLFLTGSIKRSDFEIFSQLIASIRPALWKADIS
jgi:peptidoglycan biosynthesis protein MviN/MurJ (putative lipid II flippase)